MAAQREIEWPTLAMLAATYALWVTGTLRWPVSGLASVSRTARATAQCSSLCH